MFYEKTSCTRSTDYVHTKPYEYDTLEPIYDVWARAAEHLGYSWRKCKARNAKSVLYFSKC